MKNRNLIESFNNAVNGIMHSVRFERNMKIHVAAAVVVVALGIYFRLSRLEFLLVILAAALVIVCELFNTAIELLVDIIVDIYHPKAKIIKSVAACSVMVSAGLSVIVGYFIFFERIGIVLEEGIVLIRHSPINITVIALAITAALVVIIKAVSKRGTPFKGGMPSGHSAIAFSITTAIALWTRDAALTMLCLIVSLLVVQSRVEGKIHSIMESIAGAALGFFVTLLLFQLFYR